eukprot:gnl/TRDRNA2_/TRDRNA2_36656_c0_seq1.p1 gnl/TRDRNA2_/TRDRNA2_36656_c0~~gnl/TRDRNA2_/TRDRNA2_36656_c0_seq1.p1  ORF type:complete len:589 (-),score=116.79 gnl/TRDRNA2_/TRDRNA2_36656_c0_seq1:87-1853(-)
MRCLVVLLLLQLSFAPAYDADVSSRQQAIKNMRPPPRDRKFRSSLVEFVVDEVQKRLPESNLGLLFANCFPNTLDTTVLHFGPATAAENVEMRASRDSRQHSMRLRSSQDAQASIIDDAGDAIKLWDSFIITGDIPAMWLRDSMNQLLPYLRVVEAARKAGKQDERLVDLLFGVVHRQSTSIRLDHYANAFAWTGPAGQTLAHATDQTFAPSFGGGQVNPMSDKRIYERKYELDSLLSLLKISSRLAAAVGEESAAVRLIADPDFVPAVETVLEVIDVMRSCDEKLYSFQRNTLEPTDTRSHGVGFPCKYTGLVRSAFRGSDDSTLMDFNIPENAMAVVELEQLAALLPHLEKAYTDGGGKGRFPWAAGLRLRDIKNRTQSLAVSVRRAIAEHGTMIAGEQRVYAYEVDGFGNAYFMDDANIPSLLALPYLGFCAVDDPLYQRTRARVLSNNNPWFFNGTERIGGVGGPHIGISYVWPMAIMAAGFTTRDPHELKKLFQELKFTATPNSLMHESFNKDDINDYTRPWFAWANGLFGDLVLHAATDPELFSALGLREPLNLEELIAGRTVEDEEDLETFFEGRRDIFEI